MYTPQRGLAPEGGAAAGSEEVSKGLKTGDEVAVEAEGITGTEEETVGPASSSKKLSSPAILTRMY